MLKRLRKAHPILFCVLAEVVFLASLFVTDLVFTIALVLFRTDFASIDTYLYSTLQELVGAMVAVLFLVRTDRAGLLRRRGSGFFNGLLVGMYPLFFIGYTTVGTLAFDRPDTPLLPLPRILTFILNMILVGVAEELVFRGALLRLLRPLGEHPANLCQAVLFAALHGTLTEKCYALGMGLIFGWAAEQTDSPAPGVVLHILNNGLVLARALAERGMG